MLLTSDIAIVITSELAFQLESDIALLRTSQRMEKTDAQNVGVSIAWECGIKQHLIFDWGGIYLGFWILEVLGY